MKHLKNTRSGELMCQSKRPRVSGLTTHVQDYTDRPESFCIDCLQYWKSYADRKDIEYTELNKLTDALQKIYDSNYKLISKLT